jgi:hypothetical protein
LAAILPTAADPLGRRGEHGLPLPAGEPGSWICLPDCPHLPGDATTQPLDLPAPDSCPGIHRISSAAPRNSANSPPLLDPANEGGPVVISAISGMAGGWAC